YTEVRVEEGDTLWSIAAEYGSPREDIRNIIYDIQKANSLDGALIYAGQVLLVPVD
ncbi:MAG: LysM peptidoglycan-binding domain-containing protein, partial [Firmicutes bacterium]|nr:LysM peptidoglycan-binding domain-containing protein [Bacillota bacterium]